GADGGRAGARAAAAAAGGAGADRGIRHRRQRAPRRLTPGARPGPASRATSPAGSEPAVSRVLPGRVFEGEGAVLDRSGWFVGGDDDAGAGRGGAGQPERGGLGGVVEQALTGADVHREDQQPVLVDQVVVDE